MSSQGDDCYFYLYSTCTKGDSCPFRHCKAALGNETVCTLWQEGRCFRQICKFRHMEIDKKRSVMPCFWENQLSGCQKRNCAFHHTKDRYVDGVYIPPSKSQIAKTEPGETDLQISETPSKTAVSTTHLRGVKKMEVTENVPSPTHPPVVINAADDDEEDDQFSEEGDDLKPSGQHSGNHGAWRVTTRIMNVQSKGPNFGIKTLKEIKSNRKKVKEEPKDVAIATLNVLESCQNPANTEKNVTVIRTVMFSKNDPSMHRSLAQRLGKRKVFSQDSPLEEESFPAVKKTLAERLGKKMLSPILGSNAHSQKKRAANPTTEFHIKTLQEIRQEKASQRLQQEPKCLSNKSQDYFCLKSQLFIKPWPNIHVKSLHEIQAEKKLRQLKDEPQKDENNFNKTDCGVDRGLQISQNFEDNLIESGIKQGVWNHLCERGIKLSHLGDNTVPTSVDTNKPLSVSLKETEAISQLVEHVQMEKIRKEKLQYIQQATNTEGLESFSHPLVKWSYKSILRHSKPQVSKEKDQGTSDSNSQTNNAAIAADAKTTVDFAPPVSATLKITKKVDCDKTLKTQSLNSADFIDAQITHAEGQCSVEPSKRKLRKKTKGKPKINVEPDVMKKQSSGKAVLKRKEQQSSPVAELKPLNTTITSTNKERTMVLLPVAESSVSQIVLVKSTSPKVVKESSKVSASDPGYSATAQTMVKSRRASIASSGKPSVLTEDDFDELIWDISDGKLEDEIDLDPSKDEDDLLMELSEMIDS